VQAAAVKRIKRANPDFVIGVPEGEPVFRRLLPQVCAERQEQNRWSLPQRDGNRWYELSVLSQAQARLGYLWMVSCSRRLRRVTPPADMRGRMNDGVVPLRQYPSRRITFACRSCTRSGRYEKATLIKRVGPDEGLVVLRLKIAKALGCKLARATLAGEHIPGTPECGAYYPGLR